MIFAGKDATLDFVDVGHSNTASAMMGEYYIGEIDMSTMPVQKQYTPQRIPNYNQGKTPDFILKLFQFLVPLAILGLAVAIMFYAKSEWKLSHCCNKLSRIVWIRSGSALSLHLRFLWFYFGLHIHTSFLETCRLLLYLLTLLIKIILNVLVFCLFYLLANEWYWSCLHIELELIWIRPRIIKQKPGSC